MKDNNDHDDVREKETMNDEPQKKGVRVKLGEKEIENFPPPDQPTTNRIWERLTDLCLIVVGGLLVLTTVKIQAQK